MEQASSAQILQHQQLPFQQGKPRIAQNSVPSVGQWCQWCFTVSCNF